MATNENDKIVLGEFKANEHFSRCMLDAYLIFNKDGKVIKSNQLAAMLLGKKSKQILKANSIHDLIKFKIDGHNLDYTSLLENMSPTRYDEVQGNISEDEDLNLILGCYPYVKDEEVIGMFLLVRDVTAETNLQDKYKVKATQSVTDKLTGLYNRAYFEAYLPEALASLETKSRSNDSLGISIIMADIDHFKMINDTHGHQAGDLILERVSDLFKQNFRKTDVICRYGGEEFLTILPQTDSEEARAAADKLREAVATAIYEYEKVVIPVTISLGVAQIDVGQETGNQAIARADAALYYAKENGRNRVCVHKDGQIS